MKEEHFIIPKKIKVGFQRNSNCYSGKLGYVIYYDTSGILRKENSWNSWRDNSIPPEELENIPTEGFMVNRYVGGYKSGWNYRQSYCRVWDPRGFEFEIEIDNFLWILDHCDCLAGKKLIGKFVYSWIGQSLVLLPTNSNEYTIASEIMKKREKITKDLKPSELKPGSLYKVKSKPFIYKVGTSKNYESGKVIFIGEGKFERNLGKNYETKLIFYDPGNGKRDFLITVNIKNIEYEVESGVLTEQEVNAVKERFELTAYSWKFWNNPNAFIEDLYIQDDTLEEYLVDNYGNREKKTYVTIDNYGKTFNFYKLFVSYYDNNKSGSGRYYSYFSASTISEKYLSYVFDFSGGNLVVQKKVLDLGKIWKNLENTRGISSIPDKSTVYPEAEEDDFNKLSENMKSIEKLPKSLVFYKTINGYYSESLQKVLTLEALRSGRSIVDSDLIIYLPIKK